MMLRLISSAKFRELHYGKKAQEMEDRRKVNNKQLEYSAYCIRLAKYIIVSCPVNDFYIIARPISLCQFSALSNPFECVW